jgi:hypothetical protein
MRAYSMQGTPTVVANWRPHPSLSEQSIGDLNLHHAKRFFGGIMVRIFVDAVLPPPAASRGRSERVHSSRDVRRIR